ncbi:hypothetical protein CANARDRAFT_8259 [[Candida] arabinofermentans NRRL YB-2248]|uniref:Mitochondrial 15S rRNA processing factor CCM1 n=1 Tax=[Candida] arabinofermentans NRRL YB-2248 TaxID=983967 RepID=A0A1E4SYW0_9ASCO|nr:hypothetical protein CANARDRAFT_8259 [[Candida] arabinofermentans NRRL YB-2248]
MLRRSIRTSRSIPTLYQHHHIRNVTFITRKNKTQPTPVHFRIKPNDFKPLNNHINESRFDSIQQTSSHQSKNTGNKKKKKSSVKSALDLKRQIDSLTSFTSQIEKYVQRKEQLKKENELKEELSVDEIEDDASLDEEVDMIFNELISSGQNQNQNQLKLTDGSSTSTSAAYLDKYDEFEGDPLTLFPPPKPYVELPMSLESKLDTETLKFISKSETQNWIPVINHLYENGNGLQGVKSQEVIHLIKSIPRDQRPLVVGKIHEMCLMEDLLSNSGVGLYNCLMSCYNLITVNESVHIIEGLYKDMITKGIQANVTTFGILTQLYAKRKDIDSVRSILNKMQKAGFKPTMEIYTTILQLYVRLNKYDLATDVFTTMKFQSISTAPSSKTYTSMILLDVLNNNIEHALSLVDEMDSLKLEKERRCYIALIKGCSTRKELLTKGWEYVLEYYSKGWGNDQELSEVMLCLAVKDGDLTLVRGLFLNIFNVLRRSNVGKDDEIEGVTSGTALKYLFNGYFHYNGSPRQGFVSDTDERVKAVKIGVLQSCDFELNDGLPFLPTVNLVDDELILKEAEVVFDYHLVKFPKMITPEIIEALLFVFSNRGENIKKFEQLWEKYTYKESTEEIQGKTTIEEPEIITETEESKTETETEKKDSSIPPVVELAESINLKIPRDDRLYNSCMHAARHFKDVIFAQKIWIERGQFRKTERFQKLKPNQQDDLDFKFARSMLSVFTSTGNLMDAYQVVLSSQNRFVWTYYHLKSLISLAETMGYVRIKDELLKVVKKGNKFIKKRN